MTQETETPFGDEKLNPFRQAKFSGFDMKGLLAIYRKNMELMTSTQEVTAETTQAIIDLQNQYIKKFMDQWNDQIKHTFSKAPFEEKVSRQSEKTKEAADRFIQYAQEVNSILAKSQERIAESFQNRFKEGLDESLKAVKKTQKKNS